MDLIPPYTFQLPVFQRLQTGWFLTHDDPELNWFRATYDALYIREEYRDLLTSILEWAFRPRTTSLQTSPPVSPITRDTEVMKMEGIDTEKTSSDSNVKLEEIDPPTVPLSRKAMRHFEEGAFDEGRPPPNPFSEAQHQATLFNRLLVTGPPGIGASIWLVGSAR
jgi:hypothetical protein